MPEPMNVPTTEPVPPNRLVPPSTTAAITLRLSTGCPGERGGAEGGQGEHPGHAGQQAGQRVHLDQVPVHPDPARRAASGFEPIAYVYLPNRVSREDQAAHDRDQRS